MLQYQDKDLSELTLEETIEFEKQMLKRVLGADRAGMSPNIIDQINGFLAQIRNHKQQKVTQYVGKSLPKDYAEKEEQESLDIGEIESQQSDGAD